MIAVTGAAGFIGSNLVHELTLRFPGYELLLVDHPLTVDKIPNWDGLESYEYMGHELFIQQFRAGNRIPSVVFHLGACSSTTETDFQYLTYNNIEYSQELWRLCRHFDIPFIYASSASVYGDGSWGWVESLPPFILDPLNDYGWSKLLFDYWMLRDRLLAPISTKWHGVRFFNVYGPRECHKWTQSSIINKLLHYDEYDGPIYLFKSNSPEIPDGCQRRDFVYVDDCVDFLIWLWTSAAESGIYNLGTGAARKFLDVAECVDPLRDIEFIDMPKNLQNQYQNYTRADMSKARAQGYVQSPTSLENGIRKYRTWLNDRRML